MCCRMRIQAKTYDIDHQDQGKAIRRQKGSGAWHTGREREDDFTCNKTELRSLRGKGRGAKPRPLSLRPLSLLGVDTLSQSDHPTFRDLQKDKFACRRTGLSWHRDLDAVLLHFREEIFYPFDFDKQSEAAAHAFGATWLIRPIQSKRAKRKKTAKRCEPIAKRVSSEPPVRGRAHIMSLAWRARQP